MRNRSDKKIIELMREQYEHQLYSTLIEMEVMSSNGDLLLDAGLEVTHVDTGEKYTVQSVQQDGNDVKISLISPQNVTGPITANGGSTVVSPGTPPQIYSLDKFQKKFKV